MGPTVYSPYPRRLASLTIIMQMKLQRQQFILRYFKTLGDVQAGVKLRTSGSSGVRYVFPQRRPRESFE